MEIGVFQNFPVSVNAMRHGAFESELPPRPIGFRLPRPVLPMEHPPVFVVEDAIHAGCWSVETQMGTVLVGIELLNERGAARILVGYEVERLPGEVVHPRAPPKTPDPVTMPFNDADEDGITFEMQLWRGGAGETLVVERRGDDQIRASRGRRASYHARRVNP